MAAPVERGSGGMCHPVVALATRFQVHDGQRFVEPRPGHRATDDQPSLAEGRSRSPEPSPPPSHPRSSPQAARGTGGKGGIGRPALRRNLRGFGAPSPTLQAL